MAPDDAGRFPAAGEDAGHGLHIYGIVPADVEITAEVQGVGDPPGPVMLVPAYGLAALVSEVNLSMPLGTPGDRVRHQQIADASASVVPTLPMRFGTVVSGETAVIEELLARRREEFQTALDNLGDYCEFLAVGRYQGRPGEIAGPQVAATRTADAENLIARMDGRCAASAIQQASAEPDAFKVAFLLEASRADELQQAAAELAAGAPDRIEVRVLGPMAAWDFARISGLHGSDRSR